MYCINLTQQIIFHLNRVRRGNLELLIVLSILTPSFRYTFVSVLFPDTGYSIFEKKTAHSSIITLSKDVHFQSCVFQIIIL